MAETIDQQIVCAIREHARQLGEAEIKRFHEMMDRENERAKLQIESQVRENVGRIACLLVRDIRFEMIGHDLRITVAFPGGKEPGR